MIFKGLEWAIHEQAHIISMSLGFDFAGEVAHKVDNGWPVDLATSEALDAFHKNFLMFKAIMDMATAGGAFGVQPLIIAAAGNESRRQINPAYRISASLPAAVCDLSVGAVRREGSKFAVANFSNCNPNLSAPGLDILSAAVGGGLKSMSGTSMACPHVAGVAALWAEKIHQGGEKISGRLILSHLLAGAQRDVFAKFDVGSAVDVGRGLVQAPLS